MDINLLPWRDEKIEYNKRECSRYALLAIAASIAALFFVSTVFFGETSYTRQYISALSSANLKLKNDISGYMEDKKMHEAVHARIVTLQQLQASRFDSVKLFNLITQVTPSGIFLTKITRNKNVFELSGDANSNFAITELIKSLDASSFLQVTQLQKVEKKEDSTLTVTHFDLKLALKST